MKKKIAFRRKFKKVDKWVLYLHVTGKAPYGSGRAQLRT